MASSTTLFFWNVQRRYLTESIARLTDNFDAQIVLLAESPYWSNPNVILNRLNTFPTSAGQKPFAHIVLGATNKRVQIFSRRQPSYWKVLKEHKYYTIWHIRLLKGEYLLLVTVHFPAMQTDQGDDQRHTAIMLRQDLQVIEPRYAKTLPNGDVEGAKTLVIGDLNANPFDAGIVGAYGLNATPHRNIAAGVERELNGSIHPYFYNPMWRFFDSRESDRSWSNIPKFKPPGTFFYPPSRDKPIWYGWYTLDQVLIRPALFSAWDAVLGDNVIIPAHDGLVPLIQTGRYNSPGGTRKKIRYSDHLPIIAKLAI